jgi:hypothetical protein
MLWSEEGGHLFLWVSCFCFVLRLVRCCFVLRSVCVLIAILGFSVVWNKGRSSQGPTLLPQNTVELVVVDESDRVAGLSSQYCSSLKHLFTDFLRKTIYPTGHNKSNISFFQLYASVPLDQSNIYIKGHLQLLNRWENHIDKCALYLARSEIKIYCLALIYQLFNLHFASLMVLS